MDLQSGLQPQAKQASPAKQAYNKAYNNKEAHYNGNYNNNNNNNNNHNSQTNNNRNHNDSGNIYHADPAMPMWRGSTPSRGRVVRKGVGKAKPSDQLWEQVTTDNEGEWGPRADRLPAWNDLRGRTNSLAGQPYQPGLKEALVWGHSDQQ